METMDGQVVEMGPGELSFGGDYGISIHNWVIRKREDSVMVVVVLGR